MGHHVGTSYARSDFLLVPFKAWKKTPGFTGGRKNFSLRIKTPVVYCVKVWRPHYTKTKEVLTMMRKTEKNEIKAQLIRSTGVNIISCLRRSIGEKRYTGRSKKTSERYYGNCVNKRV